MNRPKGLLLRLLVAELICLLGCTPGEVSTRKQTDLHRSVVSGAAATKLDAPVPSGLAADAQRAGASARPRASIVDFSQCVDFDTVIFTVDVKAEMPTCGKLAPPLTMRQLCGFAQKIKSINAFRNAQLKLLEQGSINGNDSLDHADLRLPEKYNVVVIDRAGWVEHLVPQNWDVYCPTQSGLDEGKVVVALWAHSTSLIMVEPKK